MTTTLDPADEIYIYIYIYIKLTVQENLYKQRINGIIGREGKTILRNKTARALSSGSIHAKTPESCKNG